MEEITKEGENTSGTRGITLITLIITVIVMLILISITVGIALNGGVVSETKTASSETQKTIDRDELQKKAIIEANRGNGKVDLGRLEKELSAGWKVNKESGECVSPHGNVFLVEYDGSIEDLKNSIIGGTAEWEQDDEGNITYAGEDIGLKVGDYVDYEKYVKARSVGTNEINELYDDLKEYSGYEGNKYDIEYPITKEDLKWKVLDIKNGQIRLICESPTEAKVYLKNYQGYNNAVYLIDKVCKTLYTTDIGTSQNLKIEDIQDVMKTDKAKGGWDYNDYANSNVDTGKYDGISEEYIGSNSYYPAIFKKEKKGWVDNILGTELDLSKQDEPISQSEAIPASPTDENKIRVTQTYWYHSMVENNWKNKEYQNIFVKDKSTNSDFNTYWLSSRCIHADSSNAGFRVRIVNSEKVNANYLYDSSGTPYSAAYCLRPVVSLSSDVRLTLVGENAWQIKLRN